MDRDLLATNLHVSSLSVRKNEWAPFVWCLIGKESISSLAMLYISGISLCRHLKRRETHLGGYHHT